MPHFSTLGEIGWHHHSRRTNKRFQRYSAEITFSRFQAFKDLTHGRSSRPAIFLTTFGMRPRRKTRVRSSRPTFLAVSFKPENTPECQVVDGQQRLTTITLLLSAIRANLTREIENGEDFANAKSALQLSAAEQTNTYKVLSGPLYDTLAARARSAVLLRLDALMSGGGASYDYDTITVEHVLPQNPKADSKWVEWFPDAQKRVDVVHSLGNLALLTRKKNASASNWDFERKKKACFSKGGVSPFVLTTQVLEHAEWTPTIVANLP
jgi:hypothetical protein